MEEKLHKYQWICGTLRRSLGNKVRKDTHMKLYKSVALPILLYGAETWTLTKEDKRRLEASEMRYLRSVAGISRLEHMRNEEIRNELQIEELNQLVKDYQSKWMHHLDRMEEERFPKIAFQYRPEGRRDVGRPRLRWRQQF